LKSSLAIQHNASSGVIFMPRFNRYDLLSDETDNGQWLVSTTKRDFVDKY